VDFLSQATAEVVTVASEVLLLEYSLVEISGVEVWRLSRYRRWLGARRERQVSLRRAYVTSYPSAYHKEQGCMPHCNI
jgi:hypothetical protein